MRCPVYRTRLLLHHPPRPLGQPAHRIEIQRGKVRMSRAHKRLPFLRRRLRHQLIRKAERIIVIAHEIERPRQSGIINASCSRRNDVVRHPLVRPGMTANGRYHDVMKTHDLFRCKTAIGQTVRRVRLTHREKGKFDLVEAIIFHRPEHIAPCRIQRFDIAITLRAIRAELFQRRLRCAHCRVVAAQFIVRLPTHNIGVAAISPRHCLSNAFRLHQIGFARKIIMSPRPEPADLAGVNINRQNIRIFYAYPFGRCRGRCPQHDLEALSAEGFDRAVHPRPIKNAFAFFDPPPGEFADTHIGQPKRTHPTGVTRPKFFRPMFGIIANT